MHCGQTSQWSVPGVLEAHNNNFIGLFQVVYNNPMSLRQQSISELVYWLFTNGSSSSDGKGKQTNVLVCEEITLCEHRIPDKTLDAGRLWFDSRTSFGNTVPTHGQFEDVLNWVAQNQSTQLEHLKQTTTINDQKQGKPRRYTAITKHPVQATSSAKPILLCETGQKVALSRALPCGMTLQLVFFAHEGLNFCFTCLYIWTFPPTTLNKPVQKMPKEIKCGKLIARKYYLGTETVEFFNQPGVRRDDWLHSVGGVVK